MNKRIALAIGSLMMLQLVVEAQDKSPAEKFRERIEAMMASHVNFTGVAANLQAVRDDPAAYLLGDAATLDWNDPRLTRAVDLQEWSNRATGGQDMPVFFDDEAGKYKIMPERFGYASDAMVKFSADYLSALAMLPEPLWGTPLGEGLAALVAAEVNNASASACLPAEIQSQACIANVLLLFEPSLLRQAFSKDAGSLYSAIMQAMNGMCTSSPETKTYRKLHENASWLTERKTLPYTLDEFLPPHPEALDNLAKRAKSGIANITVRARIIAAAAANRYEIPVEKGNASRPDEWESDFEELVQDAKAELALRTNPKIGAITTLAGPEGLRHDPSVLAPLMVMATQIDAAELGSYKNVDGAAFLEALHGADHTETVLELAGADPAIEVIAPSARPAEDAVSPEAAFTKVVLAWERLERLSVEEASRPRFERVLLELVDIEPLGSGMPIRGIEQNTLITVKGEDGEVRQIPAGEAEENMLVLGYGKPAPADKDPVKTWYTVWRSEAQEVPRVLEMALENDAGSLILGLDTSVSVQVGNKVVWRQAWHLDPKTTRPFNPDTPQPSIAWVKQVQQNTKLQFLHLTHRKRYPLPDNIVVSPPENPSLAIIVEAAPVHAGLIESSESINTPAGWKQVNSLSEDSKETSGACVTGVFRRPDDYPWPLPELTPHPTRVLRNTPCQLQKFYACEFDNGATLRLGPTNWLLVQPQGKGALEEVPIDELRGGETIVADVNEQGAVGTLKLVRIEVKHTETPATFQAVQLANLPYAPVGPIIISVDKLDKDVHQSGIAPASRVALANADPDGIPLEQGQEMTAITAEWPEERAMLAKRPALFYDFAMGFVSGRVNCVEPRETTRTLMLALESPDGSLSTAVEVGPSHNVAVVKGANARPRGEGKITVDYDHVYNLTPGDRVLVAMPGDESPVPWNINTVIPRFYPRESLGLPVVEAGVRWWQNAHAISDSGFVNNVVVLFGRPALEYTAGKDTLPELPGQPGEGKASGDASGDTKGGGPSPKVKEGGTIAKILQRDARDPIAIPRMAKETLLQRAGDIEELMKKEAAGVSYTNTPILKCLEDRLPETMPILDKGKPGATLERFVWETLRLREVWLENPHLTQMGALLQLESLAAIYAHECGAKETATLLLQDITELTAFALCEGDKCKDRIQSGQGLEHMLKIAAWLAGAQDDDFNQPINVTANSVITDFIERQGGEPKDRLTGEGGGVYEVNAPKLWRDLAQASSQFPFYTPFPSREALNREKLSEDEPEFEDFASWLTNIMTLGKKQKEDEAPMQVEFEPPKPRLHERINPQIFTNKA